MIFDSMYSIRHFIYLVFFPHLVFFTCNVFANLNSNIVTNSNFTNLASCAGDWEGDCAIDFTAKKSGRSSISIVSTPSANRKLSLKLGLNEQKLSSSAMVYQEITNIISGKQYRLSAWVKADNFQGDSMLFITDAPPASYDAVSSSNQIAFVQGVRHNSSWLRISLEFRAPDNGRTLYAGLAAQTESLKCASSECGTIQFDNLTLRAVTDSKKKNWQLGNVCNDYEFLDLLTETCRNLDKRFGFSAAALYTNTLYLNCSEISADRINAAIQTLGKSGGTLLLAPCRVALTDDIELTSNVTLRGAGVGRTVLFRANNWRNKAGALIRLRGKKDNHIENVILTDLTVQGSAPNKSPMNNIQIRYASNVLVERIETRNAGKSGISIMSSQQVTVRYITAHGSLKWHGIESKDCYIHESADGDDDDSLVSRDECAHGIPDFYTENIAIYSNLVFNNNQYGIDSHASYTEVAGNRFFQNGYASKFPEPAHKLWIHNNEFSMSGHSGLKIALQKRLGDETLVPHNHAIYENLFLGNEGYGVRIHDRAHSIYLIKNEYRGNQHGDKLRVVNGNNQNERVFICADDGSYDKNIDGHPATYRRLRSPNRKCNLDRIGEIFYD